jgi:predicted metal-dependent HD superfamily phosphohydrolase
MVEQLMTFWSSTWQALRLPVSNDLGLKVCAAYAQAQRHYHTQQHLMECLQLWQETQHLAQYSGEIAVALWFHDAVYEPFAANNERQSAAWALEVLQQAGADRAIQARVDESTNDIQHGLFPKTLRNTSAEKFAACDCCFVRWVPFCSGYCWRLRIQSAVWKKL